MRYLLIAVIGISSLTGCSSIGKKWKDLISGGSSTESQPKAKKTGATYSEQNQLMPTMDRRYRRTTRKSFDDGSHLEARSGSLWVMEGQGAYLFSENTVRMIGDPLAIRVEGEPQEQLSAKADVIASLLKQLEERRKKALARNNQEKGKKEEKKDAEKDPNAKSAAQNLSSTPGAPDDQQMRGPASTDSKKL